MKKYQPELIHICGLSFGRFWERTCYIVVSKIFNKPIFIHYLGAPDLFYEKSGLVGRSLIVTVLNQASHISFLSNKVRNLMKDKLNQDRVSVIPSSVDCSLFKERIDTESSVEIVNVLFLGGAHPIRKGIEDVTNIIERVLEKTDNVNFTCAGSRTVLNHLNQLSVKNWEKRIKFIGYFDESHKAELFLESDIFLLPSYNEGLPYAIIEAIASGMVIVSSDVGGIPEVVGPKSGATFKIGDYDSMSNYIIKISKDKIAMEDISKFNQDIAKEKHSLKNVIQKIAMIYKDILTNYNEH